MDQNACSSPHLIIWLGENNEIAKGKFWSTIFNIAKQQYDIKTISVIDKYSQICDDAIDLDIQDYQNYDNILYIITLDHYFKRGKLENIITW